jgi:hypothetical protein
VRSEDGPGDRIGGRVGRVLGPDRAVGVEEDEFHVLALVVLVGEHDRPNLGDAAFDAEEVGDFLGGGDHVVVGVDPGVRGQRYRDHVGRCHRIGGHGGS